MAVTFAFNIKELFSKSADAALPDNGYLLEGTNGQLVILIHGMTGTPHEMRYLAGFINRKGYTVSVPRLAKHGAPLDILKRSKWQEFYQSVRSTYVEMKGKYSHVYVGGLSMGALLALLLAEEFKDIKGVSCLSPTLFYDGWNSPWYRWLLPVGYYTPLKYVLYFKEEPPYGIKNPAIQRRIHEYYATAKLEDLQGVAQFGYPYFPVSLLHQLTKLVKFLCTKLNRIDTPVQLIQAKDDDMTSIRNSQFIYDRLASKQKELVLLENCYHVITADQEREKVALKMVEFFDRTARTTHV